MADFKVVKSEFNDALNTAAKAKESFSMAVVRTAAVNKKFQFSALGPLGGNGSSYSRST